MTVTIHKLRINSKNSFLTKPLWAYNDTLGKILAEQTGAENISYCIERFENLKQVQRMKIYFQKKKDTSEMATWLKWG